jgi:hypothetical protein
MEHFPSLYILEEKERRERRETYGKGREKKRHKPPLHSYNSMPVCSSLAGYTSPC